MRRLRLLGGLRPHLAPPGLTMSILPSHVLHNHNTFLSFGSQRSSKQLWWYNICNRIIFIRVQFTWPCNLGLHDKVFVKGTMSFSLWHAVSPYTATLEAFNEEATASSASMSVTPQHSSRCWQHYRSVNVRARPHALSDRIAFSFLLMSAIYGQKEAVAIGLGGSVASPYINKINAFSSLPPQNSYIVTSSQAPSTLLNWVATISLVVLVGDSVN